MANQPKLSVGQRVRKCGYMHEGIIEYIGDLGITVKWDDGYLMKERPGICHPGELELIK